MTDNTASNPAPEPQDQPRSDRNPMTPPRASGANQAWEVVNFPGQMAITDVQETAPAAASTPSSAPLHRTEELIQLIQDLNQCNDALLIRVSDLEESLERSQTALQAEVERNQGVVISARNPAPAQVAQLLSELDAANDGLRRATIHNETLQTELEASQQRVAQLERECTLLQQRFSEKNTALQQAEDSCRDLKARLHRQQRYTLQFKTALEKCLNMANDAQPAAATPAMVSLGTEDSQPVAMPKAQEIQPWSAPSVAASHQADALSNLIQSFKPPAAKPSAPAAAAPAPMASTPVTAAPEPVVPEIWAKPAAEEVPAPDPETPAIMDPWLVPAAETEPSPGFTEPSPWGAPLIAQSAPEPIETAAPPQIATPPQTLEAVASFPEPFQARPVVKSMPTKAEPALSAPVSPQPATTPVAHPQRSQRKISSLAAVQLPSFGRPPRRS
jgi:hypothetical protein